MRIFKNKWINKFAEKQNISDDDLREAVLRAEQGLIDADLGSGVIKQRIARRGQGRSGGYRSIILFKQGDRAFVVYAFAKNDRENMTYEELIFYKQTAHQYLNYADDELDNLKSNGTIMELEHHEIQE